MSSNAHQQGLLDTNILILRRWINLPSRQTSHGWRPSDHRSPDQVAMDRPSR